MRLATMLVELETKVVYSQQAKNDWLEVDKEVLLHLNKGEMPDCGYVIYKNIRLCLEDTAEEIGKKEAMDVHAITFKDEAKNIRVRT